MDKPSVVIIDDCDLIVKRMSLLVRKAGYRADEFTDSMAAFNHLRKMAAADRPHILLADWEMPELSGVELCRRLKEGGVADYVYIILLTGHDDLEHIQAAFREGANDYVVKPLSAENLASALGAGIRVLNNRRILNAPPPVAAR